MGWQGFSLDKVRAPMSSMGMLLFEPPNVGGWAAGAGGVLDGDDAGADDFGTTIAASQKENLAVALESDGPNAAGIACGDARFA